MSWTCPNCTHELNPDDMRFCAQCGAPKADGPSASPPAAPPPPAPQAPPPAAPEAPPAASPPAEKKKMGCGLWALILIPVALILTCVIGIIAAIAVPNFLQAKGRGQQKKAVSEVRMIGTACEAYATDHGAYPDTGRPVDAYYGFVEAEKLRPFLEPTYIAAVPASDPWGHPYLYGISQEGDEYIVICTGSDGENMLEAVPESPEATNCFEDEIVLENGALLRYPDGVQKKCR